MDKKDDEDEDDEQEQEAKSAAHLLLRRIIGLHQNPKSTNLGAQVKYPRCCWWPFLIDHGPILWFVGQEPEAPKPEEPKVKEAPKELGMVKLCWEIGIHTV